MSRHDSPTDYIRDFSNRIDNELVALNVGLSKSGLCKVPGQLMAYGQREFASKCRGPILVGCLSSHPALV